MMLKEGHHEAYSKSNEINTHWNFWKRTKHCTDWSKIGRIAIKSLKKTVNVSKEI